MTISPEYLAGFFDGEGCVTSNKFGNLQVSISNGNSDIIEAIKLQFPHNSFATRESRAMKDGYFRNPAYQVQWSGKNCIQILEYIKDHVHVKKEIVQLGLELAKLNNERGSTPIPSGRIELGNKIRAINHK